MESAMSQHDEAPRRRRRASPGGYRSLDVSEYDPDVSMALTARAAHCLDWAALAFPKQYVPYTHLLKAIMGYRRTPVEDNQEVLMLRRNMTRVREILLKKYGRVLDSQPGLGVRATVDDADTLTVALPKKMARFRAAKVGLATTVNLIDPAKVPNTPEYAPWKAWLNRSVKEVMRQISDPTFESKLLPPAKESDGK